MPQQELRSDLSLNVDVELLHDLISFIERENHATACGSNEPKIELVTSREQLQQGAAVMARAFIHSHDKAWLAWLSAGELRKISKGDYHSAERKIARMIRYTMAISTLSGGVIVIESAKDDEKGQRVVRGAALRKLPPARPVKESMLRTYGAGGVLSLMSYGPLRAVAAINSYYALWTATAEMISRQGIPERRIDNVILCVCPTYQQKRIASRLCAPFHELADRHGLYMVLQSSNPAKNDARVFSRMGFNKVGEHRYGVSVFNNVGPYTMSFMVRAPKEYDVGMVG